MKQCDSLGCTRPAEVPKEVGTVFSMTSTSTKSKWFKELCKKCANAEDRVKKFMRPAEFDKLR